MQRHSERTFAKTGAVQAHNFGVNWLRVHVFFVNVGSTAGVYDA